MTLHYHNHNQALNNQYTQPSSLRQNKNLKNNQQVTFTNQTIFKTNFHKHKNVQADAFGWSVLLFLNVIIQFKRVS